MRIGPVHDTGLSAVLWSSIPATASIVAPQEQNRTEHTYARTDGHLRPALLDQLC